MTNWFALQLAADLIDRAARFDEDQRSQRELQVIATNLRARTNTINRPTEIGFELPERTARYMMDRARVEHVTGDPNG